METQFSLFDHCIMKPYSDEAEKRDYYYIAPDTAALTCIMYFDLKHK